MIAVNYSTARDNLKMYCDAAVNDYEKIIITRKMGENVVLISEAEFNNLMENLYIRSNMKNYERLLQSIDNIKAGKVTPHELIKMEDE